MGQYLSKEIIEKLSYTDFIALINQTNVPPGSYTTLTQWRINSGLNDRSNIFEVGCTTGFSILNLAKSSGCKGLGVDISATSIEQAKKNAMDLQLEKTVKFHHADASNYKDNEYFSHIVVGAALGFFPNSYDMVKNMVSLFDKEGYILASPFYAIKDLPQDIIDDCRTILGITPTYKNYKDIMGVYEGFIVEYENRASSILESDDEIKHYCTSTTERAALNLDIKDEEIYTLLYKRLYDIRVVCNNLRIYQNYTVLVLKYDKDIYPRRYVELF